MTSTTQSIDWAPYKAKASDFESLEGWMYRVACYVSGVSLEQARATAEILLTLPLEMRCVWHAVWVYHGKQGKCDCVPCSREATP